MTNLFALLMNMVALATAQGQCEQAVIDTADNYSHIENLNVTCIDSEYRADFWSPWPEIDSTGVVGWFDVYTNSVFVMDDLGYQYTTEVIEHEIGHAWDWQLGGRVNGYPSYFSETNTGFDLEEFARMYSFHAGMWPENEIYPDTIPTNAEFFAMEQDGWLPVRIDRPVFFQDAEKAGTR